MKKELKEAYKRKQKLQNSLKSVKCPIEKAEILASLFDCIEDIRKLSNDCY